jgi:hypothetical protein
MEAPEKSMPVYKDNKTGTWYVSKRYQDWDGKERRLFKRNFATKKEAKEYESSFISQKKGNPSIRFRDFIEIYYEDRRQNTKPSTFLTKKNVIENCIRPYFDDFRLADITPKEVMNLEDGRYALIEIKLGQNEVDEGAKHLLEIERLIAEHNNKEKQVPLRLPDLKIVITGTQFGYKREDGVFVIPLGCLKD